MNRRRVLVRSLSAVIVSSLLIAAILAGCAGESVQMKGKPSGSGTGSGGGYVGFDPSVRPTADATGAPSAGELWIIPTDGYSAKDAHGQHQQSTEGERRALAEAIDGADFDSRRALLQDRGIEPQTGREGKPLRINGVIREKRDIAGIPYATISVGAADNVTRGMEFGIEQNGQFLGTLTVDSVEAQEATGRLSGPRVAEIQRGAPVRAQAVLADQQIEIPGSGSLMTRLPDSQTPVPVPLKHTDVKASITGYIATVDVTQQYHNPYSGKIEAVYVFPLPANAAVNEFLMTIGDRKIRGIIRERAEAEQIYKAARAQGHVASLMTQERPNVFTQSVANIEPGKQIDVNVKYFHTLEYVDGWYEYVFPMVVGPRFNPPGSTDGIGAVGRGDRGASGQTKEVQYLRPNERSGRDISLALDIDAGVTVEKLESRNHKVNIVKRDGGNVATVRLDDADTIPNKDFVLRYKVAGDRVKSAVMAQRDAKGAGGHFTLMLFPPETLKELPRKPLEMVFTLDVSGSMSGQPIEQSKAAIRYALNHMRPDDTFNVVRFAGSSEQMAPGAVPANRENVAAALQYIESMDAGGGTMMIEGIRRSLAVSPSPDRLRFVAFLTDGFIGNEPEILREIHQLRQNTRIFSFGVGSSPNRYLLDHMAKFGAGCAAYLGLNDNADTVMAEYFERIAHPALTDLAIDWGGMNVTEVYPQKLPDLFVGRPVIFTGRFTGRGEATVKVRGKVGGESREIAIPVNLEDAAANHAGIKSVWARGKIADLFDRATYESNPDLPGEVKQVALEHGLMSAYTAFVAVDSTSKTAGDHGTTVAIPVPVPQGVRYETTVPE